MSTIGGRTCFTYSVVDDNKYEVNEYFSINLTTTEPDINLGPNHKIIIISDDDSESPYHPTLQDSDYLSLSSPDKMAERQLYCTRTAW